MSAQMRCMARVVWAQRKVQSYDTALTQNMTVKFGHVHTVIPYMSYIQAVAHTVSVCTTPEGVEGIHEAMLLCLCLHS